MNRRLTAVVGASALVTGLAAPIVAHVTEAPAAVTAAPVASAKAAPGADPTLSPTSCDEHATPAFVSNGITAHRGYSGAFPENTMTSLRQGIAAGADWIELDVFVSADGQVVVNHDTTTGRTGDKNYTIANATWEELRQVDVAYGFRTANGLTTQEVPVERMPLLSEALQMVACQGHTRVSIQPKTIPAVDAAVAVVHELGVGEWVGFNDGSLPGMSRVKELDPSLDVFWDTAASANIPQAVQTALDRGFETIVMNEATVNPANIATVQAAGLKVGAWTINDLGKMQQFFGWGIDRVYTDFAAEALALVTDDDRDGLSRGLVGHWPLDDKASPSDRGAALTDEVATRNPLRDGRLQGNAVVGKDPHSGRLGRAVELDGWHDHVQVTTDVLPDSITPYTAAAWFRPAGSAGSDRQFVLETAGAGAISIELAAGTGHLKYGVQTAGQSVVAESDVTPTSGAWHHVAVTYDPGTGATQLYLDGRELTTFVDAKETASGRLAATAGLRIGANRDGNARYFRGSIDDVAVWTRVLDGEEVASIWADGAGRAIG